MDIKDVFKNNNFISLFDDIHESGFDKTFLLGEDEIRPEQLVDAYISEEKDELYLVINVDDEVDCNEVCNEWDKKIVTFTTFGSEDEELITNLRYNVVQVVLFRNDLINRSPEGSLHVSRKIFLKYVKSENGFEVDENELYELPFFDIPVIPTSNNNNNKIDLEKIMPDRESMAFMYEKRSKQRRNNNSESVVTSLKKNEYQMVAEWLNNED